LSKDNASGIPDECPDLPEFKELLLLLNPSSEWIEELPELTYSGRRYVREYTMLVRRMKMKTDVRKSEGV
jgi:hypothetical protein